MNQTKSLTIHVNFREPEQGEEPNYLGWFDKKENDYTLYAPNLDFMNQLLHPNTVHELEKQGLGKCRKIVYEKNGKKIINKLQ